MEGGILIPKHTLYLYFPNFWVSMMSDVTKQNSHLI